MSSYPEYCTSEFLHSKRFSPLLKPSTINKKINESMENDEEDVDLMAGSSAAEAVSAEVFGEDEEWEREQQEQQAASAAAAAEASPVSSGSSSSSSAAATPVSPTGDGNNNNINPIRLSRKSDAGNSDDHLHMQQLQHIYNAQRLASLKYNYEKQRVKKPFLIGVCGGSASGKTTVCNKIVQSLSDKRVVVISQDSFYKVLNQEERTLAKNSEFNFDHPDAFDYELFEQTVDKLRHGKSAQIPCYDFKTHSRLPETYEVIMGVDVIIVEGILLFYSKILCNYFNMKIFVDTDADTRLVRRIKRDITERGRDLMGVLNQYERFVKPSFDDYIMPTKKYADIIVPRGGANDVAIHLLTEHIKMLLQQQGGNFANFKF